MNLLPHVRERNIMFNALRMEDFEFSVRLGVGAEERAIPQLVRVSAELRFAEMPMAAVTDDLNQTVCYGRIAEAIRSFCEPREFKLIERLGVCIFEVVQGISPA